MGHDTLGRWDGATWAYHLPDALGSVRQTVDGAGAVTAAREWTPYGVELGAAQAGLGYTGEYWDAGVELQYLRARWYAPRVGRFKQRDPWRGDIKEPQTLLQGYVYVVNNPIKYTDPSGHIKSGSEAEEALRIIRQLQRDYKVNVLVDFGWRHVPVRAPEPGQKIGCAKWEEGAWRDITELGAVFSVARRFEDKAGSAQAARRAIGGVTIERVSQSKSAHWGGKITIADYSFDQPDAKGTLKKQWGPRVAIAHELAHYWDWKTGSVWSRAINASGAIVGGMSTAIGGEPGPTWWARTAGITEDWAESVAGYLFPKYFHFLREEAKLDPAVYTKEYYDVTLPSGRTVTFGPGLGPRHYLYVAAQFRALSTSTP